MMIQVEVSLYPLGTTAIGEAIDAFVEQLSRPGVNIVKGNMSTMLDGELSAVFAALKAAFEQATNTGASVMVLKMSNACPLREIYCSTGDNSLCCNPWLEQNHSNANGH
jgi:uncharacterized protein YqgV (UPF0045/DUF77 family)